MGLYPQAWRMRLAATAARAGLPATMLGEGIVILSLLAAMAGTALAGLAVSLLRGSGMLTGPSPTDSGAAGYVAWGVVGALMAGALPGIWLRGRIRKRRWRIEQGLPFVLDLMTLCVEAGLSTHGALRMAATNGPPGPLRDVLGEALADMRAGLSRAAALQALADRCGSPLVRQWTAALAQADALGISLGPVLREQGRLCRSERAWRAERLALQAPVKMLLPLIGCIFPCTFIVLAFPIAVRLLQGGW
ncbi:type II secretion system F family protein [Achromobacter sp.]|uniref:type II secretion system F family protein n=1 Tax=Achromobacter sp. TaxID=134375 RepID=UPI002583B2BB|nr:type II secretion system F family protein [Achromobacter sp.]